MSETQGHPPQDEASRAAADTRARETAIALRNGLKMGSSLLITWSVAIIVKLRLPQHLGPIRQGHFGFAESFATMFFATLGLGIDTYLAKEVAVRPKHASDVVGGVFALRAVMGAVLFAVMVGVLLVTGRSKAIVLTAMVFGASNFFTATNGTLGVILNTTPRVGAAAVTNVVAKLIWGAGLLIGLHYDVSLPILALPALVGEVLRVSAMIPANRREVGLEFRIDVAATRAALLESVPMFVNGLAMAVLSSLGMSVLEFIRKDEREVGWFAACQNLAYLCVLLFPVIGWVVMPLLSRAFARSEHEGMDVLRRCIEAIVVTIVPITVLISAGSDVLIHYAFGNKYAPAHTGLSILALMFVMTYMNTLLAMTLIILHRGWSVTVISTSAVFITAVLMPLLVPLGRHLIGEGGECAGASTAVIASEACVLVSMLTRFREFPLDGRDTLALAKSIGLGIVILIVDHFLRGLGAPRLALDAVLYAVAAFAIGIVKISDFGRVMQVLRPRSRAA